MTERCPHFLTFSMNRTARRRGVWALDWCASFTEGERQSTSAQSSNCEFVLPARRRREDGDETVGRGHPKCLCGEIDDVSAYDDPGVLRAVRTMPTTTTSGGGRHAEDMMTNAGASHHFTPRVLTKVGGRTVVQCGDRDDDRPSAAPSPDQLADRPR